MSANDFLTGRRIAVTGGSGFLGREVVAALNPFEPASIFVPRSRDFDLREREAVRRLFDVANPDVVIHLAAVVGGIAANRAQPGRFFYDNAMMGLQIVDEARLRRIAKLVLVGTICSYPKHTPIPFREDDFWNGYPEETNAPYGLAKKMLTVQAQAYREEYGLNAISLLPVNLYGPGDNFDVRSSHVIPALIRKVSEAQAHGHGFIEVWGSGRASREFLLVRDAARGIALATNSYNDSNPVNLGSGEEITIAGLAQLICELCGFKGTIRWDASQPEGQPRRCLDTSRAQQQFGFAASTSLREGLRETIDWYRKTQTNT